MCQCAWDATRSGLLQRTFGLWQPWQWQHLNALIRQRSHLCCTGLTSNGFGLYFSVVHAPDLFGKLTAHIFRIRHNMTQCGHEHSLLGATQGR